MFSLCPHCQSMETQRSTRVPCFHHQHLPFPSLCIYSQKNKLHVILARAILLLFLQLSFSLFKSLSFNATEV